MLFSWFLFIKIFSSIPYGLLRGCITLLPDRAMGENVTLLT